MAVAVMAPTPASLMTTKPTDERPAQRAQTRKYQITNDTTS